MEEITTEDITEVSSEEASSEEDETDIVFINTNMLAHEYITEVPILPDERDYYRLMAKHYNLDLMFFWLFLTLFVVEKLFKCFRHLTKG